MACKGKSALFARLVTQSELFGSISKPDITRKMGLAGLANIYEVCGNDGVLQVAMDDAISNESSLLQV